MRSGEQEAAQRSSLDAAYAARRRPSEVSVHTKVQSRQARHRQVRTGALGGNSVRLWRTGRSWDCNSLSSLHVPAIVLSALVH